MIQGKMVPIAAGGAKTDLVSIPGPEEPRLLLIHVARLKDAGESGVDGGDNAGDQSRESGGRALDNGGQGRRNKARSGIDESEERGAQSGDSVLDRGDLAGESRVHSCGGRRSNLGKGALNVGQKGGGRGQHDWDVGELAKGKGQDSGVDQRSDVGGGGGNLGIDVDERVVYERHDTLLDDTADNILLDRGSFAANKCVETSKRGLDGRDNGGIADVDGRGSDGRANRDSSESELEELHFELVELDEGVELVEVDEKAEEVELK